MTDFMAMAIEEAEKAAVHGEVPVGAVLVNAQGGVVARSGNRTEELCDPTAHAEVLVLRAGCVEAKSPRLEDCTLYVTLEPCALCAAAISFARVDKVVFGAYDPKGGGVDHGARFYQQPTCHHVPEVIGGVEETRCAGLLKAFFAEKR